MLDYAVQAAAADEPQVPVPRAMVFLSGGPYSEKQNVLAEQFDLLGAVAAFFAYPAKESEWNEATEAMAGEEKLESWEFYAFEPGAHGTKLFASDPSIITQLASWLKGQASEA